MCYVNGKKTLRCVAGANTIIVKHATDAVDKPVRIISDGIDIWCLLIEHTLNNSSKVTYLETMRIEKESDERVRYNTEDIIHTFKEVTLNVLFLNLSCQDITSLIFTFGKTSVLPKIQQNTKLRKLADKLYVDDINLLEIGHKTVKFFELLNSLTLKLSQLRRQNHNLAVSG